MKISSVIPCAGIGKRLKTKVVKPLVLIQGKPIFLITLERIIDISYIRQVVLVVNKNSLSQVKNIIKENKIEKKIHKIVLGGNTRAESVFKGLEKTSEEYKYVLIHDCVRPFFTKKLVDRLVETLELNKDLAGVIPGIGLKSTVKEIDQDRFLVNKTLNRSYLMQVQTPQIVRRENLIESYKNLSFDSYKNFTDDSQILENFGYKVKLIKGEEKNIKITTQRDLELVNFFNKQQ